MTPLTRIVPMAIALLLCLQQNYCLAQDKSKTVFGKVNPADFVIPASSIIDSNANAVILSDKIGRAHV